MPEILIYWKAYIGEWFAVRRIARYRRRRDIEMRAYNEMYEKHFPDA